MRLNLCCGSNVFPGWLNVDHTDLERDYLCHLRDADPNFVWPEAQQAAAKAVREGRLEFMRHDVRKGLPWPDGSVDAIYIGQAIEHFNRRTEAPALLKECARVLRQYGVIRLTTPSLQLLIDSFPHELDAYEREQPAFFSDALPEDQLSYLLFGASGAGSTNDNYEGHHHCYTWRSLGQLLNECGLDTRVSDSPEFSDCVDFGMSHSFAIEAVKP
jgi:predicted SAM-dependent methyltransferase